MTPVDMVLSRLTDVMKHGHGQVLVKVLDGRIVEIEATKRDRPK